MSATIANLNFALNLPPEKVSNYLAGKENVLSSNWEDIWQENNTKIFTVTRAMRMDILEDIRGALQASIDEGKTFQQFQKELKPKLKAKGWWGKQTIKDKETGEEKEVQLGSPWRLKTIYQTNMQTAYMVGRYREMIVNVENRPFWMYDAINDSHTRPSHAALDDKIFRYDDPFWDTHYPPNGFKCRCSVRALSQSNIDNRNLSVESSEGRMLYKAVPKSKNSDETTISSGIKIYDKKTGNFPVVWNDPGWNYNPGKVSYQTDLWASGKLKNVPEVLQESYLKDMVNNPWHKKAFSNWVEKVSEETYKAKGSATIAGYMNFKTLKNLESKNIVPQTPAIVINDNRFWHGVRDVEPDAEGLPKKPGIDDVKELPSILSNPDAILYEPKTNNILFVAKGPIKDTKYVVHINRQVKGFKDKINLIKSMGMVYNHHLKGKEYDLIWGKL